MESITLPQGRAISPEVKLSARYKIWRQLINLNIKLERAMA
jgi:hypothetical protein